MGYDSMLVSIFVSDYVCVMDVGLLELSLRSSDGKDPVSVYATVMIPISVREVTHNLYPFLCYYRNIRKLICVCQTT